MAASRSWYPVYCRPRQERTALENLERQGYRCYLPLCRHRRRRDGKWRTVTGPLFPRYLFVHVDMQRDNTAPIRSTRGVASLVRFNGRPARMPEGLVEALMARDDEHGLQPLDPPALRPGDQVRVVDGALAGYQGLFVARSGQERVVLLMRILGAETRIRVPAANIEAA